MLLWSMSFAPCTKNFCASSRSFFVGWCPAPTCGGVVPAGAAAGACVVAGADGSCAGADCAGVASCCAWAVPSASPSPSTVIKTPLGSMFRRSHSDLRCMQQRLQRRCAGCGLMLHQLLEAVPPRGHGDGRQSIGPRRFHVERRIADHAHTPRRTRQILLRCCQNRPRLLRRLSNHLGARLKSIAEAPEAEPRPQTCILNLEPANLLQV